MIKSKSGQAMIEFICGLVGLVVIIAVLLQINVLSQEHLFVVVSARNTMGELMEDSSGMGDGQYLSGWQSGADDHNYSADDVSDSGDAASFIDAVAYGLDINALVGLVGSTNQFSNIAGAYSGDLIGAMEASSVTVESDPIELLPGIRKLVYGKDELEFVHEIYMPWMNNVTY